MLERKQSKLSNKEGTFEKKLEEAKKMKKKYSAKNQFKCNACGIYMNPGLLSSCRVCRGKVCYACVQ